MKGISYMQTLHTMSPLPTSFLWWVHNVSSTVENLKNALIETEDRAKAIRDAAESDQRPFTNEEQTELDKLFTQFDAVKNQLEGQEKAEATLSRISIPRGTGRRTTPEGPDNRGRMQSVDPDNRGTFARAVDGTGLVVGEDVEGRQIRAYAPKERVAEFHREKEEFSFQNWIRAAYSGDWSKLPRNAMSEQSGADGGFMIPLQ
jgi:HK97 family phage major capsid protein